MAGGNIVKDTIIFNFPEGIPGFEDYHAYKFIPDEDSPLAQLICCEDNNIGFILVPPHVFYADYEFELDDTAKNILEINEKSDISNIQVWSILTNNSDISKITINLRAPVILNFNKKIGIQYILSDDRFSTKEPLQIKAEGQEGEVK